MSQTFTAITSRSNGADILAEWFNILRSAGVSVEGYLGVGYIVQTSFTIANNQSSVANVTSCLFDNTLVTSARVDFEIKRKTATALSEVVSCGHFYAIYRTESSSWDITSPVSDGDIHGVTFTITSAGQVQYTSTNITGVTYSGVMKFKSTPFAV